MAEKIILLTIKNNFAEQILVGDKPTEYRKIPPKILKPTRTILYVSGVKKIVGECTMDPVHGDWTSRGYPLPVHNPLRYTSPLSWRLIRKEIPRIRKPQENFRYIDPTNADDSKLLKILQKARNASK